MNIFLMTFGIDLEQIDDFIVLVFM